MDSLTPDLTAYLMMRKRTKSPRTDEAIYSAINDSGGAAGFDRAMGTVMPIATMHSAITGVRILRKKRPPLCFHVGSVA